MSVVAFDLLGDGGAAFGQMPSTPPARATEPPNMDALMILSEMGEYGDI